MSIDHLVMVLGVARSGTSSVASALAAAGVDFGDDLKPADWQNPKGNYEDFPLSRLNQKTLAACNRTWSSLRPLPRGWQDLPAVTETRHLICKELRERFLGRGLVGIKDPRLVILFPLYMRVLAELGLPYTVIATRRDPVEVRKSIKASGYFHGPFERVLCPLVIARYNRLLRDISTREPTHVVEFGKLVSLPAATLTELLSAIPFRRSGIVPDLVSAIARIDPALYRVRG